MMIGNSYYSPLYFDFFGTDRDEGVFIDDPNNSEFNADWKSAFLVNYVTDLAKHFRTNHIMFPMGGDF